MFPLQTTSALHSTKTQTASYNSHHETHDSLWKLAQALPPLNSVLPSPITHVCLVLGTPTTELQLFLTAYMWRKYLPDKYALVTLCDGTPSNAFRNMLKTKMGTSTTVVDLQRQQWAGPPKEELFIRQHLFGRKLGALLSFNSRLNVLYSDNDICLFKRPAELLFAADCGEKLIIAPDKTSQAPCHEPIAKLGSALGFDYLPSFNAGFFYAARNALDRRAIHLLLDAWHPANDSYYAEQTLLSCALSKRPRVELSTEIYVNHLFANNAEENERRLLEDKNVVLRHYMSPIRKHYFEAAQQLSSLFMA